MQDEGSGGGHRSLREIVLVWEAPGVSWEEGCPPDIPQLQN